MGVRKGGWGVGLSANSLCGVLPDASGPPVAQDAVALVVPAAHVWQGPQELQPVQPASCNVPSGLVATARHEADLAVDARHKLVFCALRAGVPRPAGYGQGQGRLRTSWQGGLRWQQGGPGLENRQRSLPLSWPLLFIQPGLAHLCSTAHACPLSSGSPPQWLGTEACVGGRHSFLFLF